MSVVRLRIVGPGGGRSEMPGHEMCSSGHANYARGAFHAHRLWTNLWMSLGHPEENPFHPEGNGAVSSVRLTAAHSRPYGFAQAKHNRCAWAPPTPPARTKVIPKIHRPYDDYQFCYCRYLQLKDISQLAPEHSRFRAANPTKIRRPSREDRP